MKLWSPEFQNSIRLHPSHQLSMRSAVITVALLTLGVAVAMALPPLPETRGIASYLPLHTLLETFAVVIAMLVFAVGWNAYRRGLPGNILLLACAFLGVGMLDFTHMISYAGMPDFVTPSGREKAIHFWLSARTLAAIALFTVAVTPWRPLASAASRYVLLASVLILIGGLHGLFLFRADLIPRTFISGQGLTPFKIYYEYALVALNLVTAYALWMRMHKPLPFDAAALFGAVCAMALSEFLFTRYADVTDIYNLLGHIYKTISYLFLYRAIFVEAIELPYNQLQAAKDQLKSTLGTLRKSKDLLASIVENAPVRIFWKDRDSRYLGCNIPFAQDAGYADPDELAGKTDFEMGWKNHAELYRADDKAVMESGNPKLDFEEPSTTPDGRTIWLSTSKVPLRDENNQIIGILGIYQDITGRKQAEVRLTESEEKFQTIFKVAPGSMMLSSLPDGKTIEVNDNFSLITGYGREEALGKTTGELGMWADTDARERFLSLLQSDGMVKNFEANLRHKSGATRNGLVSGKTLTIHGNKYLIGTFYDITEAKKAEAHIERLAHFDQLTGLPNRSLLSDRFSYALSLAQRSGGSLAVMFFDLDHFKHINDTLGHAIGDQLLMEVAKRSKATLREEDTVSRQGGDEFMLLLHNTDADGATYVATKLMEAISQPCQIEQHELITTISIGIAIYPHDGEDFETLSKNADVAMYRVKQGGRNNFRFYTPEMQAHSARTLQLANALRHALARNELSLHYQPQLSIQSGHIVGAEALLRWRHPELGMISPAEFIPIAEDSGQIIPIGEWVLRTAAKQLKDWMDNGLPAMVVAVNLSAVQFRQANITELVTHILDEVELPYEYMELELTEAVAMGDPLAAIGVMDKLHERGIRMSIDDFGTGYSSLSYLKKFNVYKLKIDQSFVRDLTGNPEDKAIVSAIINMARSLGIQTIAEGVETAGQLAFLRLQGCDEVQGYYFSKPLTTEQFEAFVKTRSDVRHTIQAPIPESRERPV